MARYAFRVVQTFFSSQDRLSIVVDTSVLPLEYHDFDELEFRRPDGTSVRGITSVVHTVLDPKFALSNPDYEPPIVLNVERLQKHDIPVGSEVWLLVEHPRRQVKLHRKFEKNNPE